MSKCHIVGNHMLWLIYKTVSGFCTQCKSYMYLSISYKNMLQIGTVALLLWSSEYHVFVIVLCLFLTVPGLVCSVIAAFPGHPRLLSDISHIKIVPHQISPNCFAQMAPDLNTVYKSSYLNILLDAQIVFQGP